MTNDKEDLRVKFHFAGRTNSIITPTLFRQANQAADCLARLGSQEEELIITSNVSFAAREFVLVDVMGVSHIRT
ncbi:hypothetical protein RHMOL_Rhmol13G0198400 [Rhododendron molle]|uniref:Uncharacterized protein n=1 Tax=Rhododendron molle TaxID=49168 RepID=A0ACC0L8L8_RHOML|nr:hypothetical protein RHMOL_Rhmol13G0198400 [Rhododendron molle]